MNRNIAQFRLVLLTLMLLMYSMSAHAVIDGITGTEFNLTAKNDYISTADGYSYLIWGFADQDNKAGFGVRAQYPAPTLIVEQNQIITINVRNELTVTAGTAPNVSVVFPGHQVTALCVPGVDPCAVGTLGVEAENDGDVVRYRFTASQPGTYMYHSGSDPALQVEMGLVGTIIVRPTGFSDVNPQAYGHADTAYTYENLFFLSEMDPRIHQAVAFYGPDAPQIQDYLDNYFANYWFINGRTAPDNFNEAYASWLPTQPYNSVPRMHPGDRLLMRLVGAGRELHPFHHHGNHARVIANDGRLLQSPGGTGADISTEVFTIPSIPGKTVDAIFEWTGEGLGWDIYGSVEAGPEFEHTCNGIAWDAPDPKSPGFDPVTNEYCPDHGKPLPVILPEQLDLAFGGWWGGSPYLGALGLLPPGEGGLNPNGGFVYMWHSHTERELTNYDIFPGGMLTMLIIEAPGVPID